jgi:hypothetical protein
MRRIVSLSVDEVTPSRAEVLENQGMAGRPNVPARIISLLDSALDLFKQLAEPRGLMEDWPVTGFKPIYDGNGLNALECPIPLIVERADAMALFAATVGSALIAKSNELFAGGEAALGYMLDAVNTSGAERLGRMMCQKFLEVIPEELRLAKAIKVQYYSPGHCGWHLSGQSKLFEALHPQEIGVELKSGWAMQPVKSIDGVLIAGEIEIHRFRSSFPFCNDCKEHKCVPRLKLLENTN